MSTGIQWTDETWNPVVGCSVVSPGCENCYAARMDKRIRGIAHEEWKPWTAHNAAYNVRLHPERLTAPLKWRKPRRVFVNSMSDLFHEQVPDEFIDRVFAAMAMVPQHTFQILTKRPERMLEYMAPLSDDGNDNRLLWLRSEAVQQAAQTFGLWPDSWEKGFLADGDWPPKNVWLGVSCEDQRRADERIPLLLETPAAVRFISAEPLLGPISLDFIPYALGEWSHNGPCSDHGEPLDWVIVGGESGPSAGPCDLAWIRGIKGQCQAADVALFVKQLGARPITTTEDWRESPSNLRDAEIPGSKPQDTEETAPWNSVVLPLKSSHGADPEEWPADLRVRQFPR